MKYSKWVIRVLIFSAALIFGIQGSMMVYGYWVDRLDTGWKITVRRPVTLKITAGRAQPGGLAPKPAPVQSKAAEAQEQVTSQPEPDDSPEQNISQPEPADLSEQNISQSVPDDSSEQNVSHADSPERSAGQQAAVLPPDKAESGGGEKK